jgi:hypothetical protein
MFQIIDQEKRRIVEHFETREEAEARLAELIEADPLAEGILYIGHTGDAAEGGATSG